MKVKIVMLLGILSVSAAAAQQWWMPIHEIRSQAYVTVDGSVLEDHSWRYNRDRQTGVCVLILTNVRTGQFALTEVSRCPEDAQ